MGLRKKKKKEWNVTKIKNKIKNRLMISLPLSVLSLADWWLLGSSRSSVRVEILHTQTNTNISIKMAQRRHH